MNILNILKDKPKGIKLHSPVCGECKLSEVNEETSSMFAYIQIVTDITKRTFIFNEEGKIDSNGECLLFPSNEMRDWNKFAWKKGDVLVNKDGDYILFSHWLDSTYTTFAGKDKMSTVSKITARYHTIEWTLEPNSYNRHNFIDDIEKTYNGKLNLETLEIEEKEHEFKPLDYVLVKAKKEEYAMWSLYQFAFRGINSFYMVGNICFNRIDYNFLPYNDQTKHLLGTTDEWKGGNHD